jgi:photosystem II stability/assembly factor-like uncharacterized protein
MKKIIYFTTLLLLTFISVHSQSQWQPVGSPTGGSIQSIIEKDGHIFTAAGQYWSTAAVYRSDDNGKTWTLKINNLPANFTVLDLTSNDTYIYTASSAGGVYRSSDYGESWETTGLQGIIYTVHANGNIIYAGTPSGIYKSLNNGNSWENISTGLNDEEVYVIHTIDNYVFAGTSDGVFRSSNGGNWTAVNNGINSQYRYIYSFSYKDGYLFTGLYNRVYRSSNFGNNWQEITNGSDGAYSLKTYDNKVYKSNYYGLHYSINNGQNWVTIYNSVISNQYLMDFLVKDGLILTGENELVRSEDNGNNWTFSSDGIANHETGPIIEFEDVLFTNSLNLIFKSFDNGLTWVFADSLPVYSNLSSFYIYEGYLFAANSGSALRTADGLNWEELNLTAREFITHNGYLFALRTPFYSNIIFRSSDLGLTWDEITTPMQFDVVTFTVFNGELFIGGLGGVYKTNDNGNTWSQVVYSSTGNPQVEKIYVHNSYLFIDDNITSGLYRSSDGINWNFLHSSLMDGSANIFISYGDVLYASTYNGGVLVSGNNGGTWQQFNEGFPMNSNGTYTFIRAIYIKDGQMFASVGRYSIWNVSLNPIPVELSSFTADYINAEVILKWQTASETNNRGFEVERQTDSHHFPDGKWEKVGFVEGYGTTTENKFYLFADKNLQAGTHNYRLKQLDFDGSFEYSDVIRVEVTAPGKFTLEQNYPNPFNPSTVIRYHLPFDTKVTLKVYNVLGKEIAVLVNEIKKAGIYEAEFISNGEFSSGVYLYTLKAGNYSDTKKFLMLK